MRPSKRIQRKSPVTLHPHSNLVHRQEAIPPGTHTGSPWVSGFERSCRTPPRPMQVPAHPTLVIRPIKPARLSSRPRRGRRQASVSLLARPSRWTRTPSRNVPPLWRNDPKILGTPRNRPHPARTRAFRSLRLHGSVCTMEARGHSQRPPPSPSRESASQSALRSLSLNPRPSGHGTSLPREARRNQVMSRLPPPGGGLDLTLLHRRSPRLSTAALFLPSPRLTLL